MSDVQPPASRPCGSCPYLKDAASGVWHQSEYEKLPEYDRETGEQPPGLFLCHCSPAEGRPRVCAGWAGCHDMHHSLGVRFAAALNPELADALLNYECEVPLFATGAEAAAHGLADVAQPGAQAARVIERLERKLSKESGWP